MYDINTRNVKRGIGFYFMFLITGLFFLVLLVGTLVSNYSKSSLFDSEVLSNRVKVRTSRDSKGEIVYSPEYYYTVDGNNYMCSSDISSNSNPESTNKKIYYNSKDPSMCMVENSMYNNVVSLLLHENIVSLLFTILPLIFIVVAVININKIIKRIKAINELNKKGKLVKNLPYHLKNTNISVNKVPIQMPVVNYTLPSGSTVVLYGDPRHDRKMVDADGMVDLVIDENNPENYFIDFEINRISGNLPTDYYKQNENISQNSQQNNQL